MNSRVISFRHKQQGIALGVGLVMLLVLTLLGVTNMSMTTLELRMAANAQNKNHAFQGVSAAIDGLIQNGYAQIQLTPEVPRTLDPQNYTTTGTNVTIQRGAFYEGRCPPGAIYDLNYVGCNHFQVDLTGIHVPSGSRSVQTQGVVVIGAKQRRD